MTRRPFLHQYEGMEVFQPAIIVDVLLQAIALQNVCA